MGLSFFAGERGTGDPGESMGLVGQRKTDRRRLTAFKMAVVGRIARQGRLLRSSRAEIFSPVAV